MKSIKTLAIATLALAAASAASHYTLNLDSTQFAGDKELKPGEYRVELAGDKAIFKSGKTVVEVPATVEKSEHKYALTTYQSVDKKIQEIDLGGTTTKIVFASAASGSAAGAK
jgi:hypothetical protein